MDADVIVVGAGLAGAAAAIRLGRAGRRVTLIEGRDRFGGRGFLKPFLGEGPLLEYGGAWITPWHQRIRSLVAEHGLSLRPRHAVTQRLWMRDGTMHGDAPAAPQEVAAHERAIARVAVDAVLLKKGMTANERGEALTGISFTEYLDRLGCPRSTRDMFSAWWTVSGNGAPEKIAAAEFLAGCVYDNGYVEGQINYWVETVVPGMAALAERMVKASGAEVLLSHPVSAVAQDAEGVTVTAAGRALKARACVLALGINQMQGLNFTSPLSDGKRQAIATGHGGRAFKLWIKAEGVPVGTLATGGGSGIEFAFAERRAEDGITFIVCFGLMTQENRPGDPDWVRAQAARLFPNARVISHDWHDWVDDPFARGTWLAALAGHEAGYEAANWQPEGRIAFASADFAREQAAWFEGAVISGEDAADAVLKLS